MMAVHCPASDRTVLIWSSQLLGASNTDSGIDVAYRCHCGAHAVVRTGKRTSRPEVIMHGDATPSVTAGATTAA